MSPGWQPGETLQALECRGMPLSYRHIGEKGETALFYIDKRELERLRSDYPIGARVELLHMDDPFNTRVFPGEKGTVLCVDDAGTIHVRWDCGSRLGVVYGEDSCRKEGKS